MPRKATAVALEFPAWAEVSPKRREHVERVVALLAQWAREMNLSAAEVDAWRAAGLLHDALRDAPDDVLRKASGDVSLPTELLHGPAAARLAERDGEKRRDVLDAVRYHTVGSADWARTGKALYMADFLEPGRRFLIEDRAFLAAQVPRDFDGSFRQVVRMKIEWALSQGGELYPESVALWHAVR